MKAKKTLGLSIVLSSSIFLSGVVPVQAQTQIESDLPIEITAENNRGGFQEEIRHDDAAATLKFFNDSGEENITSHVNVSVVIDGVSVDFSHYENEKRELEEHGVKTIDITTHLDNAIITRTFIIQDNEVHVKVEVENTTDNYLDISTHIVYDDNTDQVIYSPRTNNRGVLQSGGVEYTFRTDDGEEVSSGLVPPDDTSVTEKRVYVDARTLVDTDKDGFPDEWEKNGFTNQYGDEFPLHLWGTDPNRPDLFLQINWMKPKNPQNVGQYAPQESTLERIVNVFDKHGYNLHIDAGYAYNNIPNFNNPYGGEKINYKTPYFDDRSGIGFYNQMDSLLKERSEIFRSGVIVPQVLDRPSGGLGLVNGGAFAVTYYDEKNLSHAIMHEFGHNLGLKHDGPLKDRPDNVPSDQFLPNYKSTMNYLYQYDILDFSDREYRSSNTLPKECFTRGLKCYKGEYRVGADWDNLTLINGEIGISKGSTGVKQIIEEPPLPKPTKNTSSPKSSQPVVVNSPKTTTKSSPTVQPQTTHTFTPIEPPKVSKQSSAPTTKQAPQRQTGSSRTGKIIGIIAGVTLSVAAFIGLGQLAQKFFKR